MQAVGLKGVIDTARAWRTKYRGRFSTLKDAIHEDLATVFVDCVIDGKTPVEFLKAVTAGDITLPETPVEYLKPVTAGEITLPVV